MNKINSWFPEVIYGKVTLILQLLAFHTKNPEYDGMILALQFIRERISIHHPLHRELDRIQTENLFIDTLSKEDAVLLSHAVQNCANNEFLSGAAWTRDE
jgi:hypothetical protein